MSPLQWRGEFDTGIREMDVEHRQLIAHIREFQVEMAAGADVSKIVSILRQIYSEIAEHFALEEKLMRRMRFPAYADHKEDHETLLDDLRDIMEAVEDDGFLDEAQLTDDLDRWFSDHFLVHDAKLYRAENK